MLQIGIDIGGTTIKVGAVNDQTEIVARRARVFPAGESYVKVVADMADMIGDISRTLNVSVKDYESIGIGVPGSIDKEGRTIINAHNLGFHQVPLVDAMEIIFPHTPIYLANDANSTALAELHAGALKGCKTAVLMTLGTGVGGGVILDGRMFNGGMGNGIELGHMILQHGGPLCTCGNRGCIETLCSATWLIARGKEVVSKNPHSLIHRKTEGNGEKVTGKTVIDSAKEGDEEAKKIVQQYLDYLSSAIVSLISLLDPEVIAIGGGVSLAGNFIFEPLKELVEERSFFKIHRPIVPTRLGNEAGIIGASMLARNFGEIV